MIPICAHCQKPIFGDYRTALGKTWHPEHFVCGMCGRLISERSFSHVGETPFHVACFLDGATPRCDICRARITGECGTDFWGHMFCARHRHDTPFCDYCGRPLALVISGAGVTLPDGRLLCHLCHQSAVYRDETAQRLAQTVGAWLATQQMQFGYITLSVKLLEAAQLASSHAIPGSTAVLGMTQKHTLRSFAGDPIRIVSGIAMLWGLPSELFAAVFAHELGHAWLFVQRVDDLPSWAEEGFCSMLACLWLANRRTRMAEYEIQRFESDPDPVYGDGFRRVRRSLPQPSVNALMTRALSRKLPESS